MSDALEGTLLNLTRFGILTEETLTEEIIHGCLHMYSQTEVQACLNRLLHRGEIQWVAFRGYMAGDR